MFGKLKEKLKSWTQGLLKTAEKTEEVEEIVETKPKKEKTKEKKQEKASKKGKPEKEIKEEKKPIKKEEKSGKKEKETKKSKEKEIPVPEIEKTETLSEVIEKKPEVFEETETITEIIEEVKEEPKKEKKGFFQKIFTKDKEKPKPIEEHEYIEPEKKTYDKEEREVAEKIIEDIKQEEKEKEKKGFFQKIFSKVTKYKISEKEFEEYSEALEMLLLENNVALEVAEKIIEKIKKEILEKEFSKKEIEEEINSNFKKAIEEVLIEPFDLVERAKSKKTQEKKPYVILFCGINGTGKTTSIAKIAKLFEKNKLSCILAAGDTFRAASIEQLKKHGDKLNVKVISHEYGSDPASVGFDAIKYAEKNNIDCVLIDTAGRMHTEKNLMAQIEKVAKVTKPDCKIFVGESITGNDIIEQVKAFDNSVHIDGMILSKADIDEKGGTALSVGYITKKPILYLGIGQEYEDLEKFDKVKFMEKLGL